MNKDFLGIFFVLLTNLIYIPPIVLILLRRRYQALMNRSPLLLFSTLFSSFMSSISISMILFLDTNSKSQWDTDICRFYSFSTYVLHFTMIIPYILRLYNVFNYNNNNYQNTSHFKRLKESFYIIIFLTILILLLFNYILYQIIDSYGKFFQSDIYICSNPSVSIDSKTLISFIWLLLHLFEIIILVSYICKLISLKEEFNITSEYVLVSVNWIGFEVLSLINRDYIQIFSLEGILIGNMLKNYVILLISGILPLLRTYRVFYLPYYTTSECLSNFNFLLINERTFNCFLSFLREICPEGVKLLNFWIDVNIFRFNQKKGSHICPIITTDLYDKYIKEGSELYIDFPSNLVKNLENSYLTREKDEFSEVYEDLSNYVYETLCNYYFPIFKNSNSYQSLRKELEDNENLYGRLLQANMIPLEM